MHFLYNKIVMRLKQSPGRKIDNIRSVSVGTMNFLYLKKTLFSEKNTRLLKLKRNITVTDGTENKTATFVIEGF